MNFSSLLILEDVTKVSWIFIPDDYFKILYQDPKLSNSVLRTEVYAPKNTFDWSISTMQLLLTNQILEHKI